MDDGNQANRDVIEINCKKAAHPHPLVLKLCERANPLSSAGFGHSEKCGPHLRMLTPTEGKAKPENRQNLPLDALLPV